MNHPVLSALVPVVLLIAVGVAAGRLRWIGPGSVKDLANLVFLVLSPALLFRTMSTVDPRAVVLQPLLAYFIAALAIFLGMLAVRGFNREAAVLGLAATFSNTFMIGVPLVALAYGQPGLVQLFPLISIHALVLLTTATVVLELAVVREARAAGEVAERHVGFTVLQAMRNAVLHPVPLPILAGLAFGQTGWTLPEVVDKPMQLLGQALGPVALLMVGVSLSQTAIGSLWKKAMLLASLKTCLHPLLVVAVGWMLGLTGVPFAVMVIAACLPIGANVFLFSQRYGVAQDLVTASVGLSTLLALPSLTLALALFGTG